MTWIVPDDREANRRPGPVNQTMRRSVLSAMASFALACGDPVSQSAPQDRFFNLDTFQGIQVPGVFEQNGEAEAEILSGDFFLKGDGTCGGRLSFRFTIALDVINIDMERECSWTQVGTDLTFTWSDSGESSGTLLSSRLTVVHFSGAVCFTHPCPTSWTANYAPISS